MSADPFARILTIAGVPAPVVDEHAFVAAGAVIVGDVAVKKNCTVEDDCLIGMNATVLNGATIGAGSLVAAGTVVLEGTVIPPRSLVAGVPGKVRRALTDAEFDRVVANARIYLDLAARHRQTIG